MGLRTYDGPGRGHVIGTIVGEKGIPARWKEPVADRLDNLMHWYSTIELPALTD